MKRLDAFIVFSHGLRNVQPILSIIRSYFPIVMLKYFKADDVVGAHSEQAKNMAALLAPSDAKKMLMSLFVKELYSTDFVPEEHLLSKTSFLLNIEPDFLFVLVKNQNPDDKMYGEGAFAHHQSPRMKECKEAIRNQFNPRLPNGLRSELHCIHSTDAEFQTEHLLNYLGLPSIQYFNRTPNEDFDLAYHVDPFDTYEIIDVDIDDIQTNLGYAENLHIRDTPHYRYLHGYKDEYESYCKEWVGHRDYADHCPETFDKLVAEFDYDPKHYVLVRKIGQHWHAADGNHRLAILAHKGIKSIKAVLLNPPNSNKIDFGWLFSSAMPCRYVILRKNLEFPAYLSGSDTDLLCDDPAKLSSHILKFAKLCKVQKLETAWHEPHCHQDLWFDNKLDHRFDTVYNLSEYGISDANTMKILTHAVPVNCGGLTVYVPDYLDDLVLRFAEWKKNPSKIKHIQYLKDRINEGFYPAVQEMLGIYLDPAGFDEIMRNAGLV